jgi:hypothetical protein
MDLLSTIPISLFCSVFNFQFCCVHTLLRVHALLQCNDGIEVARRRGRYCAVDATHGTCAEKFNMTTILATDIGGEGMPIAVLYLADDTAATLWRALQWVTDRLKERGITFCPERCFADDANHEHSAIRAVWRGCQVRVCLWHVLQRNLVSHVKSLVGNVAYQIECLVWAAGKGGTGEHDAGRATVSALPRAIYAVLGSPTLRDQKYHPAAIEATLWEQAAALFPRPSPVTPASISASIARAREAGDDKITRETTASMKRTGAHEVTISSAVSTALSSQSIDNRSAAKLLEAYTYCMNRLFGVDPSVAGTIFNRVADLLPPYAVLSRHDTQLCNNALEAWHKYLKYDFILTKDRGTKARKRPLWDMIGIMINAVIMCLGKWRVRADAGADHRERFPDSAFPAMRNVALPHIFCAFSKLLGLSVQLHDRVWRQYAGFIDGNATTSAAVHRIATEKTGRSQRPHKREFVVQRCPPQPAHRPTIVVVDTSSPAWSFECTCIHYNDRIICAHIFTTIEALIGPPTAACIHDGDKYATLLIKTLGKTRWLGECAEASASFLLTEPASEAVALARSGARGSAAAKRKAADSALATARGGKMTKSVPRGGKATKSAPRRQLQDCEPELYENVLVPMCTICGNHVLVGGAGSSTMTACMCAFPMMSVAV